MTPELRLSCPRRAGGEKSRCSPAQPWLQQRPTCGARQSPTPGEGQNLAGKLRRPRTAKGPGRRHRCLNLDRSPGDGDGKEFVDYLAGEPSTLDV